MAYKNNFNTGDIIYEAWFSPQIGRFLVMPRPYSGTDDNHSITIFDTWDKAEAMCKRLNEVVEPLIDGLTTQNTDSLANNPLKTTNND
jgi:hypothetical protein